MLSHADEKSLYMKVRFLGANQQVTGSCTLLEVGDRRVLIDCGLFQEPKLEARNKEPLSVPADQIDVLVLTHAHLDHVGRLPWLLQQGFAGRALATAPTVELARLVLRDAARVQAEESESAAAADAGEPAVLYDEQQAIAAADYLEAVPYWEPIELSPDLAMRLRDAGHILGSASVELVAREGDRTRRLVFSGDVGQADRPLVRDPSPTDLADYVVLESTYGDHDHPDVSIEDEFARIVNETVQRHGKLLIAAFAIERAQEILFYLARLIEQQRIAHVPTFLDSPMAAEATAAFAHHRQVLDTQTHELLDAGQKVMDFTGLTLTPDRHDSMAINRIETPAIIIAGAGMCTGGRILHHLSHHLHQSSCTLLLTGYQAQGTLGRQLLEGAEQVIVRRPKRAGARTHRAIARPVFPCRPSWPAALARSPAPAAASPVSESWRVGACRIARRGVAQERVVSQHSALRSGGCPGLTWLPLGSRAYSEMRTL